jgi:hypothetical protein
MRRNTPARDSSNEIQNSLQHSARYVTKKRRSCNKGVIRAGDSPPRLRKQSGVRRLKTLWENANHQCLSVSHFGLMAACFREPVKFPREIEFGLSDEQFVRISVISKDPDCAAAGLPSWPPEWQGTATGSRCLARAFPDRHSLSKYVWGGRLHCLNCLTPGSGRSCSLCPC